MPRQKTHCKNGHALATAPARSDRPNARRCRICLAEASRRSYERLLATNPQALKARVAAQQRARIHGPKRAEILAAKRAYYHRMKQQAAGTGGIGWYFALT